MTPNVFPRTVGWISVPAIDDARVDDNNWAGMFVFLGTRGSSSGEGIALYHCTSIFCSILVKAHDSICRTGLAETSRVY